MISAFLWFNAAAYIALGLWCAASVEKTSASVGFKMLDASGRCEFTTVYGGLQLGLGLIFGWLALHPEHSTLALGFSLLVYAPLVLFRAIGLMRFWPVAGLTLTFAGFEVAMLLIALLLRY